MTTTLTPTPAFALEDVTLRRGSREILRGISLTVHPGEHWALLGPNGAGKSTILGFCGAVTHPTSGTVHVLGHQLGRVNLQDLRQRIGHVNPRHPVTTASTVREVVLTGLTGTVETPLRWRPSEAETRRAAAVIDQVGLSAKADYRWPTLSQGERGRALIARALLPQPRLLLLDEPTTGLDLAAREQLLDALATMAGADDLLATVLVTHHLEELPETTTHAALVADGQILASGPAGDVLTTENVTAGFAHPIEVEHRHGRWHARSGTSSTSC